MYQDWMNYNIQKLTDSPWVDLSWVFKCRRKLNKHYVSACTENCSWIANLSVEYQASKSEAMVNSTQSKSFTRIAMFIMNWEGQCLRGFGEVFFLEVLRLSFLSAQLLFRLFSSAIPNPVFFTVNLRGLFTSNSLDFTVPYHQGLEISEYSDFKSICECAWTHNTILTVILQWRKLLLFHLQSWRINSRAMLQSLQWQKCVPTCQGLF